MTPVAVFGLQRCGRSIIMLVILGGLTSCTKNSGSSVDPKLALLHAAAYGADIEDLNVLRASPEFCHKILQLDCLDGQALLWVLHHELRRGADQEDEPLDIRQTLACDVAFNSGPAMAAFALEQLRPNQRRAHNEAALLLLTIAQTRRNPNLLVAIFADDDPSVEEHILEEYAAAVGDWNAASDELVVPLANTLDDIVRCEQAKYPPVPGRGYWGDAYLPYFRVIDLLGTTIGSSISDADRDRTALAEGVPPHLVELRLLAARWRKTQDGPRWGKPRIEMGNRLDRLRQELNKLEEAYRAVGSDPSFSERVEQAYADLREKSERALNE